MKNKKHIIIIVAIILILVCGLTIRDRTRTKGQAENTAVKTEETAPSAEAPEAEEGSTEGSGAQIIESNGDVVITIDDELLSDGE